MEDSDIQMHSNVLDDTALKKNYKLMYFMNMQIEALSLPRACYNFLLECTIVRWKKIPF